MASNVYTIGSEDIEGDDIARNADGSLTVFEAGETKAIFPPGKWGKVTVEKNDPNKPRESKPASKKAEKEAESLTGYERDVQALQEQAQDGNPYGGKPDPALLGADSLSDEAKLSENVANDDDTADKPKAKRK